MVIVAVIRDLEKWSDKMTQSELSKAGLHPLKGWDSK